MRLQELHDDTVQVITPELTSRIRQLVQDLEALPGVSVAVVIHQDGGRDCPMAVGGDEQALAVHLARLLPAFLMLSSAAQACPCPACVAARETGKVRA